MVATVPLDHPLFAAAVKVKRCEVHLHELKAILSAYDEKNPFGAVTELNPRTGWTDLKFKIFEPIPPEISLVAGDAIHNLRSSLDLLVCDLARHNHQVSRTAISETSFPTGADRKSFDAACATKIRRLAPAAQACIKATEAFVGGEGEALRYIHQLDIADKHHLLLIAAGSIKRGNHVVHMPAEAGYFETEFGPAIVDKCPLEDGDVILSFSPDCHPDTRIEMEAPLFVALNEPGILHGQPVVQALAQAHDMVVSLVNGVLLNVFGIKA